MNQWMDGWLDGWMYNEDLSLYLNIGLYEINQKQILELNTYFNLHSPVFLSHLT